MKFLKKLFSNKWVRLVAAPFALIYTVFPNVTHAFGVGSLLGIGDISYSVISSLAFGITWIIQSILGFFIIVETYAIEQVLAISFSIIDSPIVKLGFPIALSVANLVFVGGLIVIAVATIIRIESYGLKNILWKVIAMAVLVNFGLVITGTILTFSDNITLYFVEAVSPAGDGSLTDFATNITAAFNPQKLVVTGVKGATPDDIKKFQEDFNTGSSKGTLIRPIIGVLLSTLTSMMILIILGSLFLVLAYRYLVISLLLVGLPLMWAAWPFPSLSKHFSDWWHKFLNQAFAPIPIVFFLWLGMMVAQQMNNVESLIHPIQKVGEGAGPAIFSFLGSLVTPTVDSLMQSMLLGAIMGAGLLISGKMGATFATSGTNAIKAMNGRVKKSLTNRASNVAKRAGLATKAATQPLQKAAVSLRQNTTARIGQGAAAIKLRLDNMALGVVNQEKQRAHMTMAGEIWKNGAHIGSAEWDNDKHDWRRDSNGDIYDSVSKVGISGGKAKVTGVQFADHHNNPIQVRNSAGTMVNSLTTDEANQWGLISDNKPISHIVELTKDRTTDEVKNIRAADDLMVDRLQKTKEEFEVAAGQVLSKREKKRRQALAALKAENEHNEGLGSALVNGLGDAAKALGVPGASGGGGGGHKAEKKDDHGAHH